MESPADAFKPFTESCQTRITIISNVSDFFQALLIDSTTALKVWRQQQRDGVLKSPVFRKVKNEEIELLASNCGCKCKDWARVFLMMEKDEDVLLVLQEQISNCRFVGTVVIGLDRALHDQNEPENLPIGIHNNQMIRDCIFEPGCRVHGNISMSSTYVQSGALVHGCGQIDRTKVDENESRDFASKLEIDVGPEAGGARTILSFPELTLVDAGNQMSEQNDQDISRLELYKLAASKASQCPLNVICKNAKLTFTSSVINIYQSESSFVEHASEVSNVTMLPHSSISSSASATHVQLQWHASISCKAQVSNTLLMEHSAVSTGGTVTSTVMGPDCHTSCGEVHHSLLGPHVNAHHQSLLIACVWLTGRGNVAYGANVGSNHTGRSADQECWAGEGTFWGLSCIIQFPLNLTCCPYSIVAAGVQMRPASSVYCLPFSLFLKDNTVLPGWVLQHSPYTLARAELKYATRSKAQRHFFYTQWDIQRYGIVQLCLRGRQLLHEEMDCKGKHFASYSMNISSKALQDGMKNYTDFIQRFALSGLWGILQEISENLTATTGSTANLEDIVKSHHFQSWLSLCLQNSQANNLDNSAAGSLCATLPWKERSFENTKELRLFQGKLLFKEFWSDASQSLPSASDIVNWLNLFQQKECEYIQSVIYSKEKDDIRGGKVIPTYLEHHTTAVCDSVIKLLKQKHNAIQEACLSLLGNSHDLIK